MDPGQALTLLIIAAAIVYGPRLVLGSVGAAGDMVAELFVPPDRALGWPHGVQESDAPWGWRSASAVVDPPAIGGPFDGADLEPLDPDEPPPPIRAGSFVVPVQPVRRDRLH